MAEEALELSVAGTRVRVVSSASADELQPLVELVEAKLASVSRPGKAITKESMMLAAIALANEVVEARQMVDATKQQSKETLQALLGKLDHVLASSEVPARARAGRRSRNGRTSNPTKSATKDGDVQTAAKAREHAIQQDGLPDPQEAAPLDQIAAEHVAASKRPAEKRRHMARAGRASDRPTSTSD